MDYTISYFGSTGFMLVGEVFDATTGKTVAMTRPYRDEQHVESLCETLCVALNGRGYCKTPLGWDSV